MPEHAVVPATSGVPESFWIKSGLEVIPMTEHAQSEHSDSVDPVRHRHLAAPEQVEHGFDEGLRRVPRRPEQEHEGHFSWGQERLPKTHTIDKRGRFSLGQEKRLGDPSRDRERRFSEGQEAATNSA
jgi:hypothetical protein